MHRLPGVWELFCLSGRSHQTLGRRSAQITSNKHVGWLNWNGQLLKITPLLSPPNRWKASSPATSPFMKSRSPWRTAPPSPSYGTKITAATIIHFDVLFHNCSKNGVMWLEQICLLIASVGGLSVDATTTYYMSVISPICVSKNPGVLQHQKLNCFRDGTASGGLPSVCTFDFPSGVLQNPLKPSD